MRGSPDCKAGEPQNRKNAMGPYESEGMPSDEAAPSQPGNESESAADNPTPDEEAGPEGVTALLPKSICPGMDIKPGQTITLKVLKAYDDEIEVEYENGNEGDEGGDMAASESQLNGLAEPTGE